RPGHGAGRADRGAPAPRRAVHSWGRAIPARTPHDVPRTSRAAGSSRARGRTGRRGRRSRRSAPLRPSASASSTPDGLPASRPPRYNRRVQLRVSPPILPMLAKGVSELPDGEGWIFEPKWDGFRVLVFRDGDELLMQSRDEKPLDRYFPELVEPLKAQLPRRCVLDGELVIPKDGGLDFEALQLRIHPAASRVAMLAKESPASVVFWDVLCHGDRDLP